MYCTQCGKELVNGERFCPICGKNQIENQSSVSITVKDEKNKKMYAFWIAVATSPVLFIIRMLAQTEEHVPAGVGGSWKSHTTTHISSGIQAIMALLLIISTILVLVFGKGKSEGNGKMFVTKVLIPINILIGIFLINVH